MDSKIIGDLKSYFGIAINSFSSVDGGWLNQLWKVSADDGEFLVKKYSNRRFDVSKLRFIESALQRQIMLEKSGVICPLVMQHENRVIRILDDGTAYMVMSFCPGFKLSSAEITLRQMQSLGSACAKMHVAFSKLPADMVKGYPIDISRLMECLRDNYISRRRCIAPDMPEAYKRALLAQGPVLEQLTGGFFARLPMGLAHEDFTSDNILFDEYGVAAIIDFDRNCYSFVWHDIGRAVLSFALEYEGLNISKIKAFINGYSQHLPLSAADIVDALRLSWCIEAPWWIQPQYFTMADCKATSFRNEIVWLTDHWFELEEIILS